MVVKFCTETKIKSPTYRKLVFIGIPDTQLTTNAFLLLLLTEKLRANFFKLNLIVKILPSCSENTHLI